MYTDCHSEQPTHVLTIGTAKLFASAASEIFETPTRWSLVIALESDGLAYRGSQASIRATAKAREILPPELLAYTTPPPVLGITWPDFGTPSLSRDFWAKLVESLRTINGDVGICCMGGHGRTGTAVSILAGVSGAMKTCPVTWLRDLYCDEVVESAGQIKYIEDMTGIVVQAKPSGFNRYSWQKPDESVAHIYGPGTKTPDVCSNSGIKYFRKEEKTETEAENIARAQMQITKEDRKRAKKQRRAARRKMLGKLWTDKEKRSLTC